ncbi:MAG: TatD family hydrolase [Tissierellia bacterium]|nr:TatD family hydrolase [Tissierellia bacterium]
MKYLVDSHCHLVDERFDFDKEDIIDNFEKDQILFVVNPGDTLQSSKDAVELASRFEKVYAAVGIHPHEAKDYDDDMEKELCKLIEEQDKIVAIGEIGLDYYYDHSPRDIQKQVFRRQLDLAVKYDLPVIIHSRDAIQDTYDILAEYSDRIVAVMHSYSGSYEMAKRFMDLGFYISISGTVTFKNARVVKEVAKQLPLDRLLIETDSPYLTPEPYRGKRNEPKYVRYVAEKISELKDIANSKVVEATKNNAKRFFRISIED